MAAANIDRSRFVEILSLRALRVPKGSCQELSKLLRGHLFERPRLRHILVDPEEPSYRLVLLHPDVTGEELSGLPQKKKDLLQELGYSTDSIPHELVLDYSYWSAEAVLRELLPREVDVPTSFETIGHVVHVNLRDEQLPFKAVIGQVLLEKNAPRIRTVVNKVGSIENQFRVPQLEVLAGEARLETEVRQHGAAFQLDYGAVYWNSRLEHEHKRLVALLRAADTLLDMFAGVGPFAIPAAMAGCQVYANDLNPESVRYLRINAARNRVDSRIQASVMDAREFMRATCTPPAGAVAGLAEQHDTQPAAAGAGRGPGTGGAGAPEVAAPSSFAAQAGGDTAAAAPPAAPGPAQDQKSASSTPSQTSLGALAEGSLADPAAGAKGRRRAGKQKGPGGASAGPPAAPPWRHFDHVVMNLPASAIDFLDVFCGLLSRAHWEGPLPHVHCYCFARSQETTANVLQRAEAALGGPILNPTVWTVRDVAPNKIMLCISFRLSADVAFAEGGRAAPADEGHLGAQESLEAQAEGGKAGSIADKDSLECVPGVLKKARIDQ